MASEIGSRQLAQVAIVVRDIEESARRWAAVLGMPVPRFVETAPGLEVHQTFRGRPSDARARLAFFDLGQVQLELIEPLGGASTWQEALDRDGEGVHHVAFWVDGMQRSVESLREHGIALVQRGDMGDGQYAYFDARERLGTTLELLERVREERVEG
ncbi:MAG: VOC family protein [Chthonomonadales bacterium]|nr:VOC family protein [Chthonomonadales bacterium]